jgi:phosphoenolpyruvate carboxylase
MPGKLAGMPNDAPEPAELAHSLLGLTKQLRDRAEEDPFGNPVLSVALAITRQFDSGELNEAAVSALIRELRDAAFVDRAARIADYVGGVDKAANEHVLGSLARHLLRPDPNDSPVPWAQFRDLVDRTRYAAVFTAHPTFALPRDVNQALAEAASGRPAPHFESHRPKRPTLKDEFAAAAFAIHNGRDALDRFVAALLTVARGAWRDRWTELTPRPIILSTWVGYDTDGRTDIGWWDTLRLRLEMKRLQLQRLHEQMTAVDGAAAIATRTQTAIEAVEAQIAACPDTPDPPRVAAFARAMVDGRDGVREQRQQRRRRDHRGRGR